MALICSWYVGARTREDAAAFLADLKERLRGRIQLTTDAHRAYESSVGLIFKSDIDWAQLHKEYASPREGQARYSPAVCVGTRTRVLNGNPTPSGSPPAMSSDRTSRCGWACVGSHG
jgi:hypothetical protein